MRHLRARVCGIVGMVLLAASSACGYTFQRSGSQGQGNVLAEKAGVRRVYIAPLSNSTYKAGVENLVYNQLVRTFSAGGRVSLVSRREEADAILEGSILDASYSPSAVTPADQLYPKSLGSKDILVASVYNAVLACTFRLTPAHGADAQKRTLWGSSFSRNKLFPGNNQLGVFGTTSPLINDSEFDRALRDLAESMMADLHESMLAMF